MGAPLNLKDRAWWLKYARDAQGQWLMGIVQEAYQQFRFVSPQGHAISRSMLSIYELALLYGLARHVYTGEGEIVDLGPLVGASTFALARGLADNAAVADGAKHQRIHSYDLFSSRGYEAFLGAEFKPTPSGSLLHEFNRINRHHLDAIVPCQADFLTTRWDGRPVEILFIDLAKTWELNQHVLDQYFRCLVPGRSIVVQQDYIHFNEYWIHLLMEYYKDWFEHLGMLYGATSFYRCTRAFTAADLQPRLKALPYEEKRALLTAAREAAPVPVREVMKSAAAKCAIEHGQLDEAQALLDDVRTESLTNDPILEVSGIANSNLAAVRRQLEAARAKAR